MMIIRMVMRAPVMIIFATVMSFRISRDISMMFLGMIPVERELKRNFDLSGHKIARDDLKNKKNL